MKKPVHTSVRRTSRRIARPSLGKDQRLWDTWLVRISHISQFGLFALTLGALYFTVIPLYKTAALEEQIAKREKELGDKEAELKKVTFALETANENAYKRTRANFVWNFNLRAGPACTGLFRRPREPTPLGSMPPPEAPLLDINLVQCLGEELQKLNPNETLRPADARELQNEVEKLGKSLEMARSAAFVAMKKWETASNEALLEFAPKGEYLRQYDQWRAGIKKQHPELFSSNERDERVSAIRRAKEKIARDFESDARMQIGQLRDKSWPILAAASAAK